MSSSEQESMAPTGKKAPHVLFFSGKGGVGKTTLAGTASVYLANKRAERVLVASTDPAHSLGDLFDATIGAEAQKVAYRVDAVEIDAPSAVDSMFDSFGDIGAMSAITDILKMASHSPGIDEIISLDLLMKLVENPEYDSVILDTAPTGHTMRLLALPELMNAYFGKLLKWRKQFGRVGKTIKKLFRGSGELDAGNFEEELDVSQGRMRMMGDLLRDPKQCSLVLVTIPEALSVAETNRTLQYLTEQGIPVAAVVVNMIQPDTDHCAFCSQRRKSQLVQIDRMGELAKGVEILTVEHLVEEPRGEESLKDLSIAVWAGREDILLGSGQTVRS
jgi:arsenite-transporting ATPase